MFTPVTTIEAGQTTLFFREPIAKKQNIENSPDRAETGGNIGIAKVVCQLPIGVSQKKDNVILSPSQETREKADAPRPEEDEEDATNGNGDIITLPKLDNSVPENVDVTRQIESKTISGPNQPELT